MMDRLDDHVSMIRTLSDQDVYKKNNRIPVETIHTEIRAEVNKIADSLPNKFEDIKNKMEASLVQSPRPAKLYGLRRIQKEDPITHNKPLRPIVSTVGTLTRCLAA